MDTTKILGAILSGEDGSYNPFTGSTPDSGFMVGGVSYSVTVTPEAFEPEHLDAFISAHEHILSTPDSRYYVGWWTHNGRIYFDISEKVDSHYLAWSLGIARKEIAVWDVANAQEISCKVAV